MTITVCDECGAPATVHEFLQTGRVIKDGRDIGQSADFCDAHAPVGIQTVDCEHVKLYWPDPQPAGPFITREVTEEEMMNAHGMYVVRREPGWEGRMESRCRP